MNATFPWVIFQISLCCKHFQKHLGSSQHTAQQNIYRRSHRFVCAAVCAQLLLTFQKFGLFISYSVRTKQRFNIQASIPQSQAFMKSIFFSLTLVPKSWAACIRTLHSTQLHWGRFSAINTTHLFSYSYIFQVSWIRSQHQQAPFVDSLLVIFQGSHQTSSPRPPRAPAGCLWFPGAHFLLCKTSDHQLPATLRVIQSVKSFTSQLVVHPQTLIRQPSLLGDSLFCPAAYLFLCSTDSLFKILS